MGRYHGAPFYQGKNMDLDSLIARLTELRDIHGNVQVRGFSNDEDDNEGPINLVRHFDAVSEVHREWPEHIEISYAPGDM